MREASVIQAGEPAIVQGIRGVCAMRGVWSMSMNSVSQIGLLWCQRARSMSHISYQPRSSFRRETLGLTA